MICPSCQTEIVEALNFCGHCGAGLVPTATSLAAPPAAYDSPPPLTQRIVPLRSALDEGERKLVSVLFCDIVHSTQLATKLGDDAMHVFINRFFELTMGEVHRFEGTINHFLGDGFIALFGAPLAHEDHARCALLAALGIRRCLMEAAAQEPNLRGIQVRIGVHTGLVVVGKVGDNLQMEYTAAGDTTNLAARLQQAAQPDTIYVSLATQRATATFFHFRELGRRAFKGIAEPLEVFELIKARAPSEAVGLAPRFGISSPLVGRDQELFTLTASLKLLREGHGGIVLLIGEPGVGKSRLLAEVRKSSDAAGIRWLEGRSVSFGRNLSYWPFLEILRQCFCIEETDNEAQVWIKLERDCIELFGERAEEIMPYLGTVLALEMNPVRQQRVKHLDAHALGRQVFVSMRRLFERLALRQPLLVLLEDWHWVDHSSVALCQHLIPLASGSAVTFWFATRPEPAEPISRVRAASGKGDKLLPVKEIVLTALAGEQSRLLLDNLLGTANLSEALRTEILRKTEGNPFFVEEVIRSLIAEGVLIQDPHSGSRRPTRAVETLVLPDTVQAVLLARIDRLEESTKAVLTLASVIGRSFLLRILQTINQTSENLTRDLGELGHAELIQLRRQLPELEYIFKHALVQEVAYSTIVSDRRRAIHRSVANAIESLFPERLEEFTSMLAYHYSKSEDWDRAQEHLLKAGDQAGRMAADAEALEHYRQAITARERAFGTQWPPLQRASLYRQMGEALFRIGQLPQALTFLNDALRHLGRPYPTARISLRVEIAMRLLQRLTQVMVPRLSRFHLQRGRLTSDVAKEVCRTVVEIGWIHAFQDGEKMALAMLRFGSYAEDSRDPELIAIATVYAGLLFSFLGMHRAAEHYYRRALPIAENCGSPLALGHACFASGQGAYYAGRWEQALASHQRGANAFRGIGHFHWWGAPAFWKVLLLLAKGDVRATIVSHEIVELGVETGDPQLHGWGLMGLGMSLRQSGEYDSAIQAFEAAVSIFESIHDQLDLTVVLAETALCLASQGSVERALQIGDRVMLRLRESEPKGFWKVHAQGPAAEAYLLASEKMQPNDARRGKSLAKALSLVRASVRDSKTILSSWAPDSLRLMGTYQWLVAEEAKAEGTWQRATELACRLNARYALARIKLESGRRLKRVLDVEQALALFSDLDFPIHAAEAKRQLLSIRH